MIVFAATLRAGGGGAEPAESPLTDLPRRQLQEQAEERPRAQPARAQRPLTVVSVGLDAGVRYALIKRELATEEFAFLPGFSRAPRLEP
eukprot:3656567-Pyramimonas_sp.AAC.1